MTTQLLDRSTTSTPDSGTRPTDPTTTDRTTADPNGVPFGRKLTIAASVILVVLTIAAIAVLRVDSGDDAPSFTELVGDRPRVDAVAPSGAVPRAGLPDGVFQPPGATPSSGSASGSGSASDLTSGQVLRAGLPDGVHEVATATDSSSDFSCSTVGGPC